MPIPYLLSALYRSKQVLSTKDGAPVKILEYSSGQHACAEKVSGSALIYIASLARIVMQFSIPFLKTAFLTDQIKSLLVRAEQPLNLVSAISGHAKKKRKVQVARGVQRAVGDDGNYCECKIDVSFEFRHVVELGVNNDDPHATPQMFTIAIDGPLAKGGPEFANAAAYAASAGLGSNKGVQSTHIATAMKEAVGRFMKSDYLGKGLLEAPIVVKNCRKGRFQVAIISRELWLRVVTAHGKHNHAKTAIPGAGKKSTHALTIDWSFYAKRHTAGADYIALTNEIFDDHGVYMSAPQLRHLIGLEHDKQIFNKLRHTGAEPSEIADAHDKETGGKWKRMFLRHRGDPLVVCHGELWYAPTAERAAHVRRFLKIPLVGKTPNYVLYNVTDMDYSTTTGPNAEHRFSYLNVLNDPGAVPHAATGIRPWKIIKGTYDFVNYSWAIESSVRQFLRFPHFLTWDFAANTNDEDMAASLVCSTSAMKKNICAYRSFAVSENDHDGNLIIREAGFLFLGPLWDYIKGVILDGGGMLNKVVREQNASGNIGMGHIHHGNCIKHGVYDRCATCKTVVGASAQEILDALKTLYRYIWFNARTSDIVRALLATVKKFVKANQRDGTITAQDEAYILELVVDPVELTASRIFPGAAPNKIMAGSLERLSSATVESENSADKGGPKENALVSTVSCNSTTKLDVAVSKSKWYILSRTYSYTRFVLYPFCVVVVWIKIPGSTGNV